MNSKFGEQVTYDRFYAAIPTPSEPVRRPQDHSRPDQPLWPRIGYLALEGAAHETTFSTTGWCEL